MIRLESQRLLFREIEESDEAIIAEIMRDPGVQKIWEHYFTDEDVREWITGRRNGYRKNGIDYLLAIRKDTKEVVGQIGILREEIKGETVWGIGYILKSQFCGNGYATEGAKVMVQYAFDCLHVDKLVCDIRPMNYASIAVAKRIGMEEVGSFVKHYKGMEMPHLIFELQNNQINRENKMTQKERMLKGMLYNPGDKEIMEEQFPYLDMISEFNALPSSAVKEREILMKKTFASCGENCYIQPPFYANWSGHHLHVGNNFYANFNFTVVDDGDIYIGDYVMVGPNVTIATAGHPIEVSLRQKALQYNQPVHIGNNVWIGAGAIILPGVTIGDNSVIGAGSVVNKDIPENVVAAGNPCRILQEIGEKDRKYYYKDKEIDEEAWKI